MPNIRAEGEQKLLGIKNQRGNLTSLMHILQNSGEEIVLFHAATILKESIGREFVSLSSEQISGLKNALINHLLAHDTIPYYTIPYYIQDIRHIALFILQHCYKISETVH